MEQEKLLEVQDLSKTYDKFFLDNINFYLKSGGIVGLIGPNGSGKSTTMKLILRIIFSESGKISFKGEHITDCNVKLFKEKIGYVGENMDFFSQCRLRKIKSFYKSFYSNWDERYYVSA